MKLLIYTLKLKVYKKVCLRWEEKGCNFFCLFQSHRPQTLKKKFFVLRSTSASGPARLEYYDSEKKFKSGSPPKRSIQLHTCFNINRRSDPSVSGGGGSNSGGKHGRFGIVLYLSDESFTVVAENEEELEAWLSMLLDYQNEYLPDGDMCREHYGKSLCKSLFVV